MRPRRPSAGLDVAAFEPFYRGNVDAIERFIARRVDDPYTAADLTADVFLAAIDAGDTYDPARGSPRAWLFGIARNVTAGHRRSEALRFTALSRIEGRSLLDDDDIARFEERHLAESAAGRLYLSIADLSEAERSVFELVAVDGLSVREAAAALGISRAAARTRLSRARRVLRAAIGPIDDGATLAPREQEA